MNDFQFGVCVVSAFIGLILIVMVSCIVERYQKNQCAVNMKDKSAAEIVIICK